MSFFPDRPRTLREATTMLSRFADRRDWIESRWYYFEPICHSLEARGVGGEKAHDLAMDLMLKLDSVMQQYDPSRGRFRPYLSRVLANHYVDALRIAGRRPLISLAEAHECESADQRAAIDEEVESAAMLHYIRMAYYHFEVQALAGTSGGRNLARPLRVLHLLLMERRSQQEIMGELQISERQVRVDASAAADALSGWIRKWVTDDDLLDVSDFARRKGIQVEFSLTGIDGLFRHLSDQKVASIHLLLVVASRKPGARPAGTVCDGAGIGFPLRGGQTMIAEPGRIRNLA